LVKAIMEPMLHGLYKDDKERRANYWNFEE
jgi:hypothetical protein